jgi:NitT/TauT family transport system substrate-binding protein
MNLKRLWSGAALALAAVLFSCVTMTASAQAPAARMTQVTVAYNPGAYMSAFFLGLDEGIFKKHGLELKLVPQSDVAGIVSGVASGQYDFGFATILHEINARRNGVGVRIVSTVFGNQRAGKERPVDGNALIAGPNSGVKTIADLQGKKLGIIGLSSFHTLELYMLAERAGIPAKSITLVQLPFPQMASALASGDVSAVITQSPFIADALKLGGVILSKPNNDLFPGAFTTGFLSNEKNIAERKPVVKAFSDAMHDSVKYLMTHEAEGRKSLAKGLKLNEKSAETADVCITCEPAIGRADVARIQDLMVKYGMTLKAVPVDELIWSEAK